MNKGSFWLEYITSIIWPYELNKTIRNSIGHFSYKMHYLGNSIEFIDSNSNVKVGMLEFSKLVMDTVETVVNIHELVHICRKFEINKKTTK